MSVRSRTSRCSTMRWMAGALMLVAAWSAAVPAQAEAASDTKTLEVLDVRPIWSEAENNAFPDLVYFRGRWLCILREASAHVSPDGVLRVIASEDGEHWESAKVFASETEDLREFEFCPLLDGRLMIIGAGCTINPDGSRGVHTSYVSFSSDGESWSELTPVTAPHENLWMKRAVANGSRLYAMGFHCGMPRFSRLYASDDGLHWNVLVDKMVTELFPNEAGLLPLPDGRMLCLQRRDGDPPTALIGVAAAPYTDWTWQDTGVRVGRPTLVQLPDGRILAPIRLLNPMRTTLCWIDPEAGTLTEALTLPSGGDGGYAGAVLQDGVLWVAYYSSHQDRQAKIYLARVRIHPQEPQP